MMRIIMYEQLASVALSAARNLITTEESVQVYIHDFMIIEVSKEIWNGYCY